MSEKAIIFDIQRASLHDGPGIRTTIFLKGCPLDCLWCHNPEATKSERQLFFHFDKCTHCGDCASVCPQEVHSFIENKHSIDYEACTFCGKCVDACNASALKIIGTEMTVDEVMAEVMADFDFYKNSGGGMTLSGGEPLFQYSFAKAILKRCKELGVHTCVETSGFVTPMKFTTLLPFIDVLLFDYKVTGSEMHEKYTGVPSPVILDNLHAAYRYGVQIMLRCPVVPGINDTNLHFEAIAALHKKYPKLNGIELLPYHDMGNSKRISIGCNETLTELKTVLPDVSQEWIEQLRLLGCDKAKIG
ncbi:MAG: glycyl-radical enzyme activating protein [Bacteroidia bacterium]|nr:glycyl-radical enzyme activating protein [Bacteroidia bacterium]